MRFPFFSTFAPVGSVGAVGAFGVGLPVLFYHHNHSSSFSPAVSHHNMSLVVKRPKYEESHSQLVKRSESSDQTGTYQLVGHGGEVLCVDIDQTGSLVASGSSNKEMLIWSIPGVFSGGQTGSVGQIIGGQKGAVLDVKWSRDSSRLYSCSSDCTVSTWDPLTGKRIRKHAGHADMVNALAVTSRGNEVLISGSDDGTVRVWDPREKEAVCTLTTSFPVIAVSTDSVGEKLYTAGIENEISVWDMRQGKVIYSLKGHTDTITGLSVSPDDEKLLSNSMDSTVRTWDIRSFSSNGDRLLKILDGAPAATLEQNIIRGSWSSDGLRVSCGSADKTAVIWDSSTGSLVNKLPGHIGIVNVTKFSPADQSVLVSASSDKTLILGRV